MPFFLQNAIWGPDIFSSRTRLSLTLRESSGILKGPMDTSWLRSRFSLSSICPSDLESRKVRESRELPAKRGHADCSPVSLLCKEALSGPCVREEGLPSCLTAEEVRGQAACFSLWLRGEWWRHRPHTGAGCWRLPADGSPLAR
jgi:hypothetical protein